MADYGTPENGTQETRLEGWKEIAAHLQRDVRTAKRWEKNEGLPVRRHNHATRSSVYAFPSELNTWRSSRQPAAEPKPPTPLWHRPLPSFATGMVMLLALVCAGDSSPEVLQARAQGSSASATRVVWEGARVNGFWGRVSPNGRLISYTDWYDTGNLMLHDLVTGSDRPLTGNKDWNGPGNAVTSAFSRDGKQVAFGWMDHKSQTGEVRILNVDAAGIPKSRLVYKNADVPRISPFDWSPDGQWLAVHLRRKDHSGQIGLIRVRDGSLRVLKSFGWESPTKMFFSPDGNYIAYDGPPTDTARVYDVFVIAVDGSREIKASDAEGDDVVIGWSPDGGQLLFTSERAGSAALWAVRMSDGRPQAEPELIRPGLKASSLGLTDSGTLYLSTRGTGARSLQIAPIDLGAGKLLGTPAVEHYNTIRPDWSPDGKYLAYVSSAEDSTYVLSIRSLESGEIRTPPVALQYFPFPRWMPDSRSLITSGTDLKGRNAIYRIDAQTGEVTFIADSVGTHVQVSPDGSKIYSRDPGRQALVERDLASGETRAVPRPAVDMTGPELSPDGRFLAAVATDTNAGTSAVLLIPVAGGEPRTLLRTELPERFDGLESMTWTPDSQALVVPRINGDHKELWLVPVSGSSARKLDINIDPWALDYGIRIHPDGKQIAFSVGESRQEVWALENFLPAAPTGR